MAKQDYNKIEVKDNMKVEAEVEETEVVKEKKQPMQKIVDVQPKKIKRNLFSRLVNGILGPEGLPGIGAYVNDEIVKPALRNIIYEGIESAARMAIFKDGGGPTRGRSLGQHSSRRPEAYRPNTNYAGRYANNHSQSEPPRERLVARSKHGVEEYIIEDRFQASEVLVALTENADRYDSTSVADYYELIGVPSQYTDNDWGWTIDSITRASIVPVRGGYVIKFPPVEII